MIAGAVARIGHQNVPAALKEAITRGDIGISVAPGHGTRPLQERQPGRLDWGRALRGYVGRLLDPEPTYQWPPRRFPDRVGLVPGLRRLAAKPNVLAIIDTSSSVTRSRELLEKIDADLATLARVYTVTVVECDEAVRRVYPYAGRLAKVVGTGGTDFRPPLDQTFLRRHQTDLVVFFTDGAGPAPDRPPPVPVVWCLPRRAQPPARWARPAHGVI